MNRTSFAEGIIVRWVPMAALTTLAACSGPTAPPMTVSLLPLTAGASVVATDPYPEVQCNVTLAMWTSGGRSSDQAVFAGGTWTTGGSAPADNGQLTTDWFLKVFRTTAFRDRIMGSFKVTRTSPSTPVSPFYYTLTMRFKMPDGHLDSEPALFRCATVTL